MYFLSGFRSDAGAFFIYFLFLYLSLVTMTAVFRLIGNAFTKFQDASAASGVFFISLFTYAGFMIPPPQMRPYFAWIRYINPFYYAFEAMSKFANCWMFPLANACGSSSSDSRIPRTNL